MTRSLAPLLIGLLFSAGCRASIPGISTRDLSGSTSAAVDVPVTLQSSLPLEIDDDRLSRMIVESQHKRVWGRLTAFEEVERIVNQLGPWIREAANQPAVQPALQSMAQELRVTSEQAKQRWIRLHEADILLESGGRDDAVSVSNAVGVSQWLEGTARRAGLRVNAVASARLTDEIDSLGRSMELRRISPAPPPEHIGAIEKIQILRSKRRLVDERYDPRKAIIAQARYILGLYRRFPDSTWLMQAYHGGEAGVTRMLKRFLGKRWPGSSSQAILTGDGGRRLSFERLYLDTSPRNRPDAFAYLYGRSDDHRYYWWKVRSALEAFALYRSNPEGFERRWKTFLPGRAKEAYWYPSPVQSTILMAETRGCYLLTSQLYRRNGGNGQLTIGDTTLGADAIRKIRALVEARDAARRRGRPSVEMRQLPGGGPEPDFNFHSTGFALDIKRPTDGMNRKILEYALGALADRHILWWRADDIDSTGTGSPHYHIVPNPQYRIPLQRIGKTGKAPNM